MENAFFQLRSPYIEYSIDSNDVLFDFRCRPANGAVHKYLHSSKTGSSEVVFHTCTWKIYIQFEVYYFVENCKELDDAPEESSCTDSVGMEADVSWGRQVHLNFIFYSI